MRPDLSITTMSSGSGIELWSQDFRDQGLSMGRSARAFSRGLQGGGNRGWGQMEG